MLSNARTHPKVLSACVLTAAAAALAGCGSSSSASTTSHAHMAAHHAMAHHRKMTHHMAMAHHAMTTHDMAMAHAELALRSSPYGQVLADAHHRVVYMFASDHGGKSACYGACAAAWPPLLTRGAPHVGSGLNGRLLGTLKRSDGSVQITYAGHPLYYFSGDKGTEIRCQHVKLNGGYWYVVRASGAPDMAMAKAMK